MSNYRLDFKEPSWNWDDTTPCQYFPSREEAEIDMRRAAAVDGQRFKHFRIYESKSPGDWVLLGEFDFNRPIN